MAPSWEVFVARNSASSASARSNARRSVRGSKSSAPSRRSKRGPDFAALAGVILLLAAIGGSAAWWCFERGYTLYFGDAEAHLNIARRVLDSRTPGPYQIGTVWLPLPHAVLIPFVMRDSWWRS